MLKHYAFFIFLVFAIVVYAESQTADINLEGDLRESAYTLVDDVPFAQPTLRALYCNNDTMTDAGQQNSRETYILGSAFSVCAEGGSEVVMPLMLPTFTYAVHTINSTNENTHSGSGLTAFPLLCFQPRAYVVHMPLVS